MAARLRKTHQEDVKKKIGVAMLIKSLSDHVEGKKELSSTQVQSAKILLDKSLSNAPTKVEGGDSEKPILHRVEVLIVDPKG